MSGSTSLLYGDIHGVDRSPTWRNRETVFAKTLEMEHDGLANFGFDFRKSCARRDAAREIRNVCGVVAFRLFDHDRVAQTSLTSTRPLIVLRQ